MNSDTALLVGLAIGLAIGVGVAYFIVKLNNTTKSVIISRNSNGQIDAITQQ